MAFKDGDFLEIEYSTWSAPDSALIATTDEKRAKDSGIYDKEVRYEPALVILGSNSVIKGLDRELHNMEINQVKKFTFKPIEAFGERMEDLVRVMPIAEFRKRDIDPYPGMRVNLDNVSATVKSVTSGRVVVDANHQYSGRDITYEVKIVKHITADNEKIDALGRTYGVKPSKVTIEGNAARVTFSDNVKKNADYFVGKASFIASAFSNLKNIEKIVVDEEYLRPKEEKEKTG